MAEDTKPPNRGLTALSIMLFGILITAAIVIVAGLALLAEDFFTLPYLTPFAHFLKVLISPLVPFLFPAYLGLFLKVCQHETWSGKTGWVLISGGWLIQHLQRAWGDAYMLYWGKTQVFGRKSEMCGLVECAPKWLEMALAVTVVVCQCRGWRWEGGYFDMWVDAMAKQDRKEQQKKAEVAAARAMDVEKGEKFEGGEYNSAEEEKRGLMAGEGMAEKEVLVEAKMDDA